MKGNPKRPLRGLALLGAAAVVVAAAATFWLHTGWHSIGLTLTDRIGDAAQALQGFTLDGTVGWTRTHDTLYFRLEDGVLQTDFRFDDSPMSYRNYVSVSQHFVLPPESRDDANDFAAITSIGSSGARTISATISSPLRCMYRLTMPDGTVVRLAAGDVTLHEGQAVAVTAYDDSNTRETSSNYDYEWDEHRTLPLSAEELFRLEDTFPSYPVNTTVLQLGSDYVLCWEQELAGRQPGLYRVHGLTNEEIRALPRDGQMYGKDVICASTEFGTLTPFYCPADAKTALAGAAMTNGFTLLLYQNSDGVLCADLVTSAGQLSDHRELGALPEGDRYTAICFPRSHTGSVVFGVNCEKLLGQEDYVPTCMELVPLRAENGKITLAHTQCINGDVPNTAVLNETGDAVLTAHTLSNTFSYVTYETGSLGQTVFTTLADHLQLEVYDLNTGRMTYQGRLHTGDLSGWEPESLGRPATLFNFSVQPQEEVAP